MNDGQPRAAVTVAPQKRSDGTYWITVTHFYGSATFQWLIPLDQADQAADELRNNIRDAAIQARRERMGLTVVDGNGRLKR